MIPVGVVALRSEALFVSDLQPSERPSAEQVHRAIVRALRALGGRGCGARVAQEFGSHPEVAVARMRWCREVTRVTCEGSPASGGSRPPSAAPWSPSRAGGSLPRAAEDCIQAAVPPPPERASVVTGQFATARLSSQTQQAQGFFQESS